MFCIKVKVFAGERSSGDYVYAKHDLLLESTDGSLNKQPIREVFIIQQN